MKKNGMVILFALTAVLAASCGKIDNGNSNSAKISETTAAVTTAATVTEAPETTTEKVTTTEEKEEINENEIKKEAAAKIKDFNLIHALMTGVGAGDSGIRLDNSVNTADLKDKNGNALKKGGAKVESPELKGMDDLKKLIDNTFSDFEYSMLDLTFAESDGALYVYPDILTQHNGKPAFYYFNTDESTWQYSAITDDYFSVTAENCKGRHDFKYTVRLDFTKDADGWKIKDFEQVNVEAD